MIIILMISGNGSTMTQEEPGNKLKGLADNGWRVCVVIRVDSVEYWVRMRIIIFLVSFPRE